MEGFFSLLSVRKLRELRAEHLGSHTLLLFLLEHANDPGRIHCLLFKLIK